MAFDCYAKALEIFHHIIKCKYKEERVLGEANARLVEVYREKAQEYFRAAEDLKAELISAETSQKIEHDNKKSPGTEKMDEETKRLQEALSSAIVVEKPNVKWSDVAGLE